MLIWTMPSLVVSVFVALAVAVILWLIVRWMTKQSSATTKEVHLPNDKDVVKGTTKKLRSDNNSSEVIASLHQSSTTERCILEESHPLHSRPSGLISEQSRTKAAFEPFTDILQLELAQERKLRERAEDWAEFLARELEAHITARIDAERRSRRLEKKMNSFSPKVSTVNDKRPVARNFKDISEAHATWQKMCDIQNKQWLTDSLTYGTDHDEKEWQQIVDANKRFLQTIEAYNKEKDKRTTTSRTTEEQCLHRNRRGSSRDGSKEDLNTEKINITVEACSPGDEQKMIGGTADFTKLRLPSSEDQHNFEDDRMKVRKGTSNSDHETNQYDKTEIDKNPLVCTDSLSNIKKTTEIWENLRTSRETLSSAEDLSPSSADFADRKGLQVSCSDITPGLVQKNLKMYETSETVENMEDQ